MNILVLGGTTFFGKRLVHKLVGLGHDVTVATRGQSANDLGNRVTRITVDRTNPITLMRSFGEASYDIVYDQICFNPQEAKAAVDVFGDRVKRYILTSTMAVYSGKEDIAREADFDPGTHPIDLEWETYSYAEGKRQAEAYFFQHAPFPVVAVRVAMVVSGDDDYTGRFDFHVTHVMKDRSVGVPSQPHPIAFVTARDTADFLRFIGVDSTYEGPINAANGGWFSTGDILNIIGRHVGRQPAFHVSDTPRQDTDYSPYAFPVPLRASNELARSIGYAFPEFEPAMAHMIDQVVTRLKLSDNRTH